MRPIGLRDASPDLVHSAPQLAALAARVGAAVRTAVEMSSATTDVLSRSRSLREECRSHRLMFRTSRRAVTLVRLRARCTNPRESVVPVISAGAEEPRATAPAITSRIGPEAAPACSWDDLDELLRRAEEAFRNGQPGRENALVALARARRAEAEHRARQVREGSGMTARLHLTLREQRRFSHSAGRDTQH